MSIRVVDCYVMLCYVMLCYGMVMRGGVGYTFVVDIVAKLLIFSRMSVVEHQNKSVSRYLKQTVY